MQVWVESAGCRWQVAVGASKTEVVARTEDAATSDVGMETYDSAEYSTAKACRRTPGYTHKQALVQTHRNISRLAAFGTRPLDGYLCSHVR